MPWESPNFITEADLGVAYSKIKADFTPRYSSSRKVAPCSSTPSIGIRITLRCVSPTQSLTIHFGFGDRFGMEGHIDSPEYLRAKYASSLSVLVVCHFSPSLNLNNFCL